MLKRVACILPFLICLVLLSGCSKEEVQVIHEDLIVDSNQAPPYNGVSTLKIENYVNKIYIDLTGIEPTASALASDVQYLKDNKLSDASKEAIAENLLNTNSYHQRFFEINSNNFIEGADSFSIFYERQQLINVRDLQLQNGDTLRAQLIQLKISELTDLLLAKQEFRNGNISLNKYYSYFITNFFYDEINMGSENFVKATFEDLFFRFPTIAELEAGEKMVDGVPSQLFLQDGNSKGDYVYILTNSNEFYQGLVIMTYLNLLSRKPSSIELAEHTVKVRNSGTLKELQLHIIRSKEYAGF